MSEIVQDLNGVDMVAVPANVATQADLETWFDMQGKLKRLKDDEMALRKRIFATYFPAPMEGTNTVPLQGGWVLKGGYPITREIDPGALGANKERFEEAKISVDSLVKYKPSLSVTEFKKLTAEEMSLFSACLIVKPGSPSLEIVLPAKAKKAGEKA